MFLDPSKLLVIGVVALVVLGPDRLPKVARTVGSLWHNVRTWRASLDEQVRGAFPDLPPARDIAAAVRSPLAFLDRLAAEPSPAAQDRAVGSSDGCSERVEPTADPVSMN